MAINLNLFNRIINLKIYRENNKPLLLTCPTKGRKPRIELSGNFYANGDLPAFNLTIKNLYLDLKDDVYTKIEVEAGYEGCTAKLEGSISTIYQEEPGPEGTTYIQCQEGEMADWLDTYINVSYDAGTTLNMIISQMGEKLGTKGTLVKGKAATLMTQDTFEHNGTARDACTKLKKMFQENYLVIFIRNNILTAICLSEGDFINVHTLKYMSAPLQFNTGGDSSGTYYATVSAPWDPSLQPGDMLIIPSMVYQRYGERVGTDTGSQRIEVQSMEFHFGTCGGTNSMKVQGYLI